MEGPLAIRYHPSSESIPETCDNFSDRENPDQVTLRPWALRGVGVDVVKETWDCGLFVNRDERTVRGVRH